MSKDSSVVASDLRIYRGLTLTQETLPNAEEQKKRLNLIPPPPPWRTFGLSHAEWVQQAQSAKELKDSSAHNPKAMGFVASERMIELVNAAICLRRPLLIEGSPGAGKTSLAYAVAQELGLPGPFRWSIVSRTRSQEGLYAYDAIGRLQEASLLRQKKGEQGEITPPDVGNYLRLGPMGMAFHASKPRRPAVLLIDEIDKSDIDMPNDLLHIFEEGFFEIPELARLQSETEDVLPYRTQNTKPGDRVPIPQGFVQCTEFPLVFMTSNEAREFPPAFLRRCLRLPLQQPTTEDGLHEILKNRFDADTLNKLNEPARELIQSFLGRIKNKNAKLATDQLLNAVYLLLQGQDLNATDRKALLDSIFQSL